MLLFTYDIPGKYVIYVIIYNIYVYCVVNVRETSRFIAMNLKIDFRNFFSLKLQMKPVFLI